ncbi:hypothetical protein B0T16DRAFT_325167 [Cercophora newfieldiana]|uniref:LYC1 C-terminal domain-containing protein n=1 Tax=Cercophora newfieldiana TaxID=92897 RepID=A0AA39YBX7_9PEZI|nr:hypothetical protein B0T16DRAFT_325167 [Cercophora newfieldiana]
MSTDAETISLTKDDVLLAEANPQQRRLTWELNGVSWAGPMSLEEYIGREQTLSETALSANGGTRYFILHHKSDPNLILSACEVLTKQALVASPASPAKTVPSYGIASVFTPSRFRGHGLASHMLRLVQEAVDGTTLNTQFGALYSDIGRSFYTRLGWPDFPSPQLTMQMEAGYNTAAADSESQEATLLTDEDIPALCSRDCSQLQAALEQRAGSGDADGKTYVAFLPDFTQMAWHFTRASYVARVMREGREVKYRGARTAGGNSWVYWDHDLRENKLKILRVVVGEGDGVAAVKALLRAALREAQDWGLPKVLVWAPGEETSLGALELWKEGGGKLALTFDEREDGSIPSLRWKGGEAPGSVAWEANEYYAWC